MPSRTTKAQRKPPAPVPQPVLTAAQRAGVLPLDYLLAVMRDPAASEARRDRAAQCAAQYVHPRAADNRQTKKVLQAEAAQQAGGVGSEWADDLHPDGWPRPQ